MRLAWRTWPAAVMLGLSMAALPAGAQPGDPGNPHFQAYAQRLAQSDQVDDRQKQVNLRQITSALEALPASQRAQASLVAFGVPAISSVKRLPDRVPADGMAGRLIPAVAARGEYSPLSFVVAPLVDVPRLEVRVSDLTGKAGSIGAGQVDVKVIKVWYQTGTAWGSYFADSTDKVLVPELLLNDENLIRVDHQTRDNYLRVDYPAGPQHVWISAPPDIDDGKFNHLLEPVADSDKLLPVQLQAGQAKQFWLTIHVPASAKPGVYHGQVELLSQGKSVSTLPMTLRVLPFELPLPRTYHDLGKPFYAMVYNSVQLSNYLEESGGDMEIALPKLQAELNNLRQHNMFNHLLRGPRTLSKADEPVLIRNLEAMKKAGFEPPIFGGFSSATSMFYPKDRNPVGFANTLRDAKRAMELFKEHFGSSEVFMFGFDEPGMKMLLTEHDGWRELQRIGAKIYSTSKDTHYPAVGFAENVPNYSGDVSRDKAIKWNMIDHSIMSYANPHTGPENPEFNRRFAGLQLYKAMYGGTGNYKYYDQHKIWNDFASTRYRGFNLVYPTQDGVIDTMAWEGFRVAMDDIRYATLMMQLAREGIDSGDVDTVFLAKQAIIWLELADENNGDLEAIRMEMVNYILQLRQRLGKGDA